MIDQRKKISPGDLRPASFALFAPTNRLVRANGESLCALDISEPQGITEIALMSHVDVGMRFMYQRAPLHSLPDGILAVGGFVRNDDGGAGSAMIVVTLPCHQRSGFSRLRGSLSHTSPSDPG